MTLLRTAVSLLVAATCFCGGSSLLPFTPSNRISNAAGRSTAPSLLYMGLYDEPLPPPPAPRGERKDQPPPPPEDEDDFLDEDDYARLFEMLPDGTEKRGLLPRLGRSLKSGVGCYFETTDRKVVNLATQTNCHLEDAAWALEACKGDVTEAWESISTARRVLLNQEVALPENVKDTDWDAELFDLVSQNQEDVIRPVDKEDYENRKAERMKEDQKRNVQDFFKGGEADERWLPTENPNPVDDEPWFTG